MTLPHGLHQWARTEMLGLFSVSATLAGLSLTIATLFNIINRTAALATFADNVLLLCAMMFMSCNALIFWCLRTSSTRTARRVGRVIECLFFGGQATMLLCCVTIIFDSWR